MEKNLEIERVALQYLANPANFVFTHITEVLYHAGLFTAINTALSKGEPIDSTMIKALQELAEKRPAGPAKDLLKLLWNQDTTELQKPGQFSGNNGPSGTLLDSTNLQNNL